MEQRKWILLSIFFLSNLGIAEICDSSQLKYEFTECLYGKRKMLFRWSKNNCTNAPPPILENISCEEKCPEGQYLGFSPSTGKAACLDCPANTYSTGSTLRFSSSDANWGSLQKEVEMRCYWVTAESQWTSQLCDSFKVNSEGTALVLNLGAVKPNTWNTLEFTMNAYLYNDGMINFEYKKLSKQEFILVNGIFRFDVGKENMLNDQDLQKTATQKFSVPLKAGYKEFRWYFNIYSRNDISNLYAEISKIEITPVNYAPLFCTPCMVGSSNNGASFCSHCNANFYLDISTNKCVACHEDFMAYPGQNQCIKRPT